jgi:hypothetical protein
MHDQAGLRRARNLAATLALLTLCAIFCTLVAAHESLLGGIAAGIMMIVLCALTAQWARAHAELKDAETTNDSRA